MNVSIPSTHRGFAKIGPTQLLIDGKFQDSVSQKTFDTLDPVTEEIITAVSQGGYEDIDIAVKAARKALDEGPWGKMDARERGTILLRWADLIDLHREELAKLEVLDNGKPISEALGYDIPSVATTIRYFAGWADKIGGKTIPISGPFLAYTLREPVGVCGLITPWNYPLEMATWKIAPCLAAGCTAILKPAEQTPLTSLRAGELALEAGLPEGVLNIVTGFGSNGAGEALVRHPGIDKIAFTGEFKTAQAIREASAKSMKRLSFELGGKSPNIILDDADLEKAVEGAFDAIFLNQGQNCCAGSRAFVHASLYDAFVDKLAKKAAARRIGCPFDPKTEHGPLIDAAQFDKVLNYVHVGETEGARLITGGKRVGERGYYVAPTVFAEVTDEMAIAKDEIFGPVVSVLKFDDLDEVIRRANQTNFGLAGAVWTRDIEKAQRVVNAVKGGTMWVNCYNIVDCAAPFGGFKDSGIGRDLGEQALDAYLETKTVIMSRSL